MRIELIPYILRVELVYPSFVWGFFPVRIGARGRQGLGQPFLPPAEQ